MLSSSLEAADFSSSSTSVTPQLENLLMLSPPPLLPPIPAPFVQPKPSFLNLDPKFIPPPVDQIFSEWDDMLSHFQSLQVSISAAESLLQGDPIIPLLNPPPTPLAASVQHLDGPASAPPSVPIVSLSADQTATMVEPDTPADPSAPSSSCGLSRNVRMSVAEPRKPILIDVSSESDTGGFPVHRHGLAPNSVGPRKRHKSSSGSFYSKAFGILERKDDVAVWSTSAATIRSLKRKRAASASPASVAPGFAKFAKLTTSPTSAATAAPPQPLQGYLSQLLHATENLFASSSSSPEFDPVEAPPSE